MLSSHAEPWMLSSDCVQELSSDRMTGIVDRFNNQELSSDFPCRDEKNQLEQWNKQEPSGDFSCLGFSA